FEAQPAGIFAFDINRGLLCLEHRDVFRKGGHAALMEKLCSIVARRKVARNSPEVMTGSLSRWRDRIDDLILNSRARVGVSVRFCPRRDHDCGRRAVLDMLTAIDVARKV